MPLQPEEKPRDDEDELDELPPIDGDGDGDDVPEPGPDDLDDDLGDDANLLDDSTGEDDPIDALDGESESESGWLDDADEDESLDVGSPDVLGEEGAVGALLDGGEETDVGEDDLAIGAEDDSISGDSGEEGFLEEDESIREDELPRLDSGGDDVESDDPDLGDSLPDDDAAEEPLPPWEDRAWDRAAAGAGGLADPIAAVSALACSGQAVIVAGEGVARIDATGRVVALEALGLRGGAPTTLATDGTWIALSTPRAGVLVSRDAGRSFVDGNGWRSGLSPEEAARVEPMAALVACGQDLWGKTRGGALVWSGDAASTWSRVTAGPRFEAIAADAVTGEVVALSRGDATGAAVARGKGGAVTSSRCEPLPVGTLLGFAANDGRVALALANRGAYRLDAAGRWERLEGTASVTAIGWTRGGTLAVALFSEGEGRAWIAEARGTDGPVRIVAEPGDAPGPRDDSREDPGEDDADAQVRALAWDDARGVMWAAGTFGLIALCPARR